MHIWTLLNTCAYFLQDLFFYGVVIGDTSALAYQTYAHHIIAILTFYETLYWMDWMLIYGCMLLFVEFSTIFLSLRTLMFYHGWEKTWFYNVNALLTFVTFFLVRVVYQIGIILYPGLPNMYDKIVSKQMSYL